MKNKVTAKRSESDDELNEYIAYLTGRAYGEYIKPKKVVVGNDIRSTSEALKQSLSKGLIYSEVDVIDLGMTNTKEIYFATSLL